MNGVIHWSSCFGRFEILLVSFNSASRFCDLNVLRLIDDGRFVFIDFVILFQFCASTSCECPCRAAPR